MAVWKMNIHINMHTFISDKISVKPKVKHRKYYISVFTRWRQCACVHFLSAFTEKWSQANRRGVVAELLDTAAKHRYV